MAAHPSQLRVAILFRDLVLGEAGVVPEWVELIPAGPEVVGLDGRRFRLERPELVVERFAQQPLQKPLDWEHSTQLKAPKGERAPAAGWIQQLEVRNGSIWARLAWTEDGKADVAQHAYKYLSPAFTHDRDGNVGVIVSAGLTNNPNLVMAALNHQGGAETPMPPKILELLKLAANASEADVQAAIQKLQSDVLTATHRAESPALDRFVPRADYELAINRATKAETEIATNAKAALEKAVDAELEAASKAGKITPSTVAYHRANCLTSGGLEAFRAFVQAAPIIAADSKLDAKVATNAQGKPQLTETQLAICNRMGLTPEEFVAGRS